MTKSVTVIGGGLAGSELAIQLSSLEIDVVLVEMRPAVMTGAHTTGRLAELVCSNSLKSENPDTSSGLLKKELEILGCRLLPLARTARVPAGHALAVDREVFSELVSETIERDHRITVERREVTDLETGGCCVVAAGPLVSDRLAEAIKDHFCGENLYFYDAISLSVAEESIDKERLFRASRYGKGGDDYWNVPFTKEQYLALVRFLEKAPRAGKRGFESSKCFDACLPVEVIAERGEDSLRFGPLKPKGLIDPRTGREPYAALQLRQETKDGSMLGLVGFQTRLTRVGQKDLLGFLPGLEKSEILRWGSIHRNTFIDSPMLLDETQMSLKKPGLFFAGQITGVEGYVESIAHGLIVSRNVAGYLSGRAMRPFPRDTMTGALQHYLSSGLRPYQPMNANFGLLPPVTGNRKERKHLKSVRAVESLKNYLAPCL